MRLNAESAFGLAKIVTPSTSSRIRPSDARGAPRRGPVGAVSCGKSPDAIIRNRSFAQSLNVSSCRLGIRASERFVCRVSTAIGPIDLLLRRRRRRAAEDRDRSDAGGRLLEPVRGGGVEDLAALEGVGDEPAPVRLDRLADEVAVEEGRRARRPRVRDGDEPVGGRGPQHDVREGQVGEQLQVVQQRVQPVEVVGRGLRRVRSDEFAHGRHRPILRAGPQGAWTGQSRRPTRNAFRSAVNAASIGFGTPSTDRIGAAWRTLESSQRASASSSASRVSSS